MNSELSNSSSTNRFLTVPQSSSSATSTSPTSTSCNIGIVSDSEHTSNCNSSATSHSTNHSDSSKANLATPSPSRRSRRINREKSMTDVQDQPRNVAGSDEDNEEASKPQKSGKSRRELPAGAVATLKAWLLSPEHFTHPYPTPQDQIMLMQKTGIDKKQLKNWFTNARRRIWKPMLKKQLEQGKMAQTGSGAVVTLAPGTTVLAAAAPAPDYANVGNVVDHSQVMQQNYQQALQQTSQQQPQQLPQSNVAQQQSQQQQFDNYSNPMYQSRQQQQVPLQNQQQQQVLQQQSTLNNSTTTYFQQNQYKSQASSMAPSNSIGSLPHMPGATPPGSMSNLNKTDSHAVLMELFARDQDLVRQATEGAKNRSGGQSGGGGNEQQQLGLNGQLSGANQLGSQHPMSKLATGGSSTLNKLGNVPSLNSWPHFSSVSSLNNLGTMTGVKSITNMSGADLVSQGSLNKKGNLAQVKSIENMGRADSYAFLEVFFDNAGTNNPSQTHRGVKREREEDENVGLSLDGDDQSPTTSNPMNSVGNVKVESSAPVAAPLPPDGQDKEGLKRAYDDALAARGLISVSRSSEKLTDLALPAKMQRTISQEYLKNMASSGGAPPAFTSFSFNPGPAQTQQSNVSSITTDEALLDQRFTHPGQNPSKQTQNPSSGKSTLTNNSTSNPSVTVPAATKCALCGNKNVDTQLRPSGHMFHSACLKPSMQNGGPLLCPIDKVPIQSVVLAIPTDDSQNINNNPTSTAPSNNAFPASSAATNTF